MPEPLWAAAVELARSDGIYAIARALQLNYQSLQCRVAIASRATRPAAGAPRGFVELNSATPMVPASSPVGPVLELSNGHGATLTIRLPAEGALDVAGLAEAFLGRGAS
jgi:hypothetical protein